MLVGPALQRFSEETNGEVPVGVAAFPGDEVFETPPRGFVEKAYNVRRWSEMPSGGHFAALEEPALFLEDVRAFARDLR